MALSNSDFLYRRSGNMSGKKICRRAVLRRVAHAGAAFAIGAVSGQVAPRPARGSTAAGGGARPTVTVLLDETIGTIRPAVYGHFLEHLGVIYDGVWVGRDSKIAHADGIRQALIDHVQRLGPTVFRWPGGCFADKYHWRDGIGKESSRPRRFGRWREDTEPNYFGTHEFMRLCRLCKMEPYLAANVGTGTAEEFQQWIEYCNAPPGRTTLSDERATNGNKEPFGVRFWGVGNESWGCGGKFTPEDYCTEYRKFTEWLPSYGTSLYLTAAGPNGNDLDWTRRFFKKWTDHARAPLNAWAAHYYCGTTGHALNFSRDQWYEMLFKASAMEKLITDQWSALAEFDPKHKVKLIVDEWGAWHPAGTEINGRHQLEQMGCLRDALVAALTLDTFNRHADKVDMANVAQLLNCLHSLFLADEDKFVATPNFYVFEMYRPHQGAGGVRIAVDAPSVAFETKQGPQTLFRVAGSASRSDKKLTLTLVHSHDQEPVEITVELKHRWAESVRQTVLAHKQLNAHNTFEQPSEVLPRSSATDLKGRNFVLTLSPASVTRLEIELV